MSFPQLRTSKPFRQSTPGGGLQYRKTLLSTGTHTGGRQVIYTAMAFYPKSVAYTRSFFLVSSTDHISAKTGATATVNISKAGGAFAAAGGTVTEVANGWYKVALNTTDTNTAGDLAFHVTATGADDTDFVDQVYDLTVANIGVDVKNWNNTAVAAPATAGIPDVNAKNINNVAATSVTTINANLGQTQPVNFTGTGASALVKSDMVDIAGAAVSTSTAQVGVNVVNAGGTAWASGSIVDGCYAVGTGKKVIRANTAAAGAASTITLDVGASATNDIYDGCLIYLTGGTGIGQARTILSYVGSTQVATVDRNWQTNPDATTTFAILPTDTPKTDSSLQVVSASVQGNVTGSVGSVTGAVGSVTGNVGGNVVGSVNSVTTRVSANVDQIDGAAWSTHASGMTPSDIRDIAGAAVSTSTAQLGVNVVQINTVATSPVTTINANQGTTQPINFTGSGASALIKGDVIDWSGTAVVTPKTSGVPVVDWIPTGWRSNTAQAGAAGSITLDASASATDSFYKYATIAILSGTGAGQARLCTAYNGTTKVATVLPSWTTNPDATSVFSILPMGPADVETWLAIVPNALISGRVDSNAQIVGSGAITSGSFAANSLTSGAVNTDFLTSTGLAASAANEIRDAILSDSIAFAGAKINNLPEGIKKNAALNNFEFFMADTADHVTGKTGLTVAVAVSIDGAAFAAATNTPATEVANGIYKINLAAADLNGDVITVKATATGADATFVTIKTSA